MCEKARYRALGIVYPAVVPDELEVVEDLLNVSVLLGVELGLDRREVHRGFYNQRVIGEAQSFVVLGLADER